MSDKVWVVTLERPHTWRSESVTDVLCTYREDAIDEARKFAQEIAKKEAARQMLEKEVAHSIEDDRESYFSSDHNGYVEVRLIKTSFLLGQVLELPKC